MTAIFRREITAFFGSLIGYVVIGIFLITLGLFLFVFPDTSLLNYGLATLDPFFNIVPNIFIFLIPAICMRSFAEERATGAIELLVTRPVREIEIVLGKYFACLTLVLLALLPTLLYWYTVYQLGAPLGNIDGGGTLGSYLGLAFLAAGMTGIGIFASALTSNQIVGFLVGTLLCFFLYFGFDYLSRLPFLIGRGDDIVESFGLFYHYESLGRGLLDTRDLVYFISIAGLFIVLTMVVLERKRN